MKHKRELGFEWLLERRNERHEAKEQLIYILGEMETERLYRFTTEERRREEWN